MSEHQRPYPVVVVGFDGSPASDVALSRAIARVGTTGELYLVHAWQLPARRSGRGPTEPVLNRVLTEAEALLNRAEQAHPGLTGISWEPELIGDSPARAITNVARTRHADEIVLGTRGLGRVRSLLGSVAQGVIHLAGCAVTVVPERMVAERPGAGSARAAVTPT